MARWSQKMEYKRLSGELAVAHARDFEHQVLPLLRLVGPSLVQAPALGTFDRIGGDLIGWRDGSSLRLVVQCKGFKAQEPDLGPDQVKQCLESIETFKSSGQRADTYLLAHNRSGENVAFRESVTAALHNLVSTGQVRRAELWPRQTVLQRAFDAVRRFLVQQLKNSSRAAVEQRRTREPDACVPLKQVPLQSSVLVTDRNQLKATLPMACRIADPVDEILDPSSGNLVVLLGEAGFGKTTVAIRAYEKSARHVFYFRAANLSGNPIGTKDLLQQFTSLEDLLGDVADEDVPTVRRIARAVIETLLKSRDTPAILVLDGLDESVFLSRRGGLQWLFNSFQLIEVPIVLVARSEFWNARLADFGTSCGSRAHCKGTRQRDVSVKVVELLPWTDVQILSLTQRYRDTLSGVAERERVDELARLIERGEYAGIYGDIPRRPLFLRFLLETVGERGVHRVGRASLLAEWATLKIKRDASEPLVGGGEGRIGITSAAEGMDATVELSFLAMSSAASLMSQVHAGRLELLPDCPARAVLESVPALQTVADPLGLVLNSLLVPCDSKKKDQVGTRLRFGHQTYHEFFMARHMRNHVDQFRGVEIPPEVQSWLDDLRVDIQ